MKTVCLALVLALSAPLLASVTDNATAKPENGCPVLVWDSWLRVRGDDAQYTLSYRNITAKNVIGAKFTLEFMDPTGDFSEYPEDLSAGAHLTPKERSYLAKWDLFIGDEAHAGYRVYVKKVAFSDGSIWQDDGSGKCSYTEDYRRRS